MLTEICGLYVQRQRGLKCHLCKRRMVKAKWIYYNCEKCKGKWVYYNCEKCKSYVKKDLKKKCKNP